MDKFPTVNPFGRSTLGSSSSLLTYEPYYGFREKPFSLSADPKFLYRSPSHATTFEDLLHGIRRREGLIVLTGDIGTGKTTLCRAVIEGLDRKTFSTFVPDPFVSREDLLKMLLIDFGVMSVDDLRSGRLNSSSRPELSYPLYEFLNSLAPLQALAVVVIDEAQNLSLPLLEEIRILSDLESPEKLLQVVLVGQLELQAKLKLPEIRQVDQRVSVRCRLDALSREGVTGYVTHRLTVAGGTADRVHFSPNAVDAVFRASGGVPRVINLICDRSLHCGHLARKNVIDLEAVTQAIADLGVGDLTALPVSIATPPLVAPLRDPVVQTPPVVVAEPEPIASASQPVTAAPEPPVESQDLSELPQTFHVPLQGGTYVPSFYSPPPSRHGFGLGEGHFTRKWRRRAFRAALFTFIAAAAAFAVLFAEAVYINRFAEPAQQVLPPPAETPARRLAPPPIPPAIPER
ncbi:MAG TPA: AAA family ATPase [Vicinamibacterales bacterium]|nr:AAA family ATPase [Vicinamibacterales bacterium]